MTVFAKDPQAILDYSFDWDDNYLALGETISTSVWSVLPAGELAIDSTANTTSTATATVSSGIAGHIYRLTNRITTSNGRTEERSITMRVQDR